MTTLTETLHAGGFLLSELPDFMSREAIVIAASQTLVAGHVLGKTATDTGVTATAAPVAGNTGNSTIAMANPAVSSKAKNGKYRGVHLTATTVRWEDPNGVEIGQSTHGAAFNKEVKFTITAGGTANVVGDAYEITVGIEDADEVYKGFDPTATDGSEVAVAILWDGVTTGAGETARATAIVQIAAVTDGDLTWPDDITAIQKAAAIADLKRARITVR
ncbi:head decoration protein [Xanthobacter sp. DSM 24535]|uniref:head decoration protein n=1 Tax=Roseixanthobacter psychrophilus TaxID=3119917 RepID=UPI003727BB0A